MYIHATPVDSLAGPVQIPANGGAVVVLPPWKHDVTRADLAHIPHSITVEAITPELRRGSDLPAEATRVVVERHAGRLVKVCSTTDVTLASFARYGSNLTLERLARGIARTYGAVYVGCPAWCVAEHDGETAEALEHFGDEAEVRMAGQVVFVDLTAAVGAEARVRAVTIPVDDITDVREESLSLDEAEELAAALLATVAEARTGRPQARPPAVA
ncbi:hypothetical protein [Nonomuraea sp. NPDC049158]|uniref:DUF6907 domain-containing protein n=1 Tax=Nonomuraea sp. NPDC049158 TaxID=3155649 RepID=UPI0033F4C5B9